MSLDADIKAAAEVLGKGGVILYPTDTIWGLGCDATNQKAVEKVYRIKERVQDKSLIILVSDIVMLGKYVIEIPETAEELIASVSEPITIIYPAGRNLPKNVLASDGSIAVRIPRHQFCQDLLREFGKPITSTSANLSGTPNPYSFSGVVEPVKEAADFIVSVAHQSLSRPKPSTIVRIDKNGEIQVLRN